MFELQWECAPDGERTFHCPHCETDREGRATLLRARLLVLGRWTVPLRRATGFLVCDRCGRSYATARLPGPGQPPTQGRAVRSEEERALLAVLAAVILSDSTVRPSEERAARVVIREWTGRDLNAVGMRRLLGTARTRWGDPLGRLRRIACLLDSTGKRKLVSAAYRVSAADGDLHPEESRLLLEIADALDLGPREVRTAMEEAKS